MLALFSFLRTSSDQWTAKLYLYYSYLFYSVSKANTQSANLFATAFVFSFACELNFFAVFNRVFSFGTEYVNNFNRNAICSNVNREIAIRVQLGGSCSFKLFASPVVPLARERRMYSVYQNFDSIII